MPDKIDFQELKATGVLPSPKGVALAVMEQCHDDAISLPALAHTILGDPVLSGRIIKMANAINPNRNRPIASVTPDTLILVGIHSIRQAVLGFSLVSSHQNGQCQGFDYAGFWSRSTAMACAAQATGSVVRIAPVAELFTCGLLAEVGQLALATARPEAYTLLLAQYAGKPIDELIAAESDLFGMGRRALTSAMMADWGMPELFIEVVAAYDNEAFTGYAAGSRQYKLAATLQLASKLAHVCLAPTDSLESLMPELFQYSGSTLGLGAQQLVNIANVTANEWQEWSHLLHVNAKPMPLFLLPDQYASRPDQDAPAA